MPYNSDVPVVNTKLMSRPVMSDLMSFLPSCYIGKWAAKQQLIHQGVYIKTYMKYKVNCIFNKVCKCRAEQILLLGQIQRANTVQYWACFPSSLNQWNSASEVNRTQLQHIGRVEVKCLLARLRNPANIRYLIHVFDPGTLVAVLLAENGKIPNCTGRYQTSSTNTFSTSCGETKPWVDPPSHPLTRERRPPSH